MKVNKEAFLKFLSGEYTEFYTLDKENQDTWLSEMRSEFVVLQSKLTASNEKNGMLETEIEETKTKLVNTEKDLNEALDNIKVAKEGLDRLAVLEAELLEQHRLSVINKIKEQYAGKGFLVSEETTKEIEEKETGVLELELSFLEKLIVDPKIIKSEPNEGTEEDFTNPNDKNTKNKKFSREEMKKTLENSLGKRR
jgi:hypothetical protein